MCEQCHFLLRDKDVGIHARVYPLPFTHLFVNNLVIYSFVLSLLSIVESIDINQYSFSHYKKCVCVCVQVHVHVQVRVRMRVCV